MQVIVWIIRLYVPVVPGSFTTFDASIETIPVLDVASIIAVVFISNLYFLYYHLFMECIVTFRLRHIQGEMYIGHSRLSVPRRIPTRM